MMRPACIVFIAVLWTAAAHAAEPPSAERGRVVYEHWCEPCHGTGTGHAGSLALTEKYHGSMPADLSARSDLTAETVHYFLRNGVSIMPFFRKTEITPAEEKDLIAYLTRNHRSVKTPARDTPQKGTPHGQ